MEGCSSWGIKYTWDWIMFDNNVEGCKSWGISDHTCDWLLVDWLVPTWIYLSNFHIYALKMYIKYSSMVKQAIREANKFIKNWLGEFKQS